MGALIPWPGGKYYMVEQILRYVPEHRVYVEPFCGGAKILFAKNRSHTEVINDIDGELTNLFRVVRDSTDEFLARFDWMLVGRQWFNELRDTDVTPLSAVERAVRFFYLLKFSYNTNRLAFCRHTSKSKNIAFALDLVRRHYKRLQGVVIECLDYRDVMAYHDSLDTFYFLDPPYLMLGDRLYEHTFSEENFLELKELLSTIRGRWLMTHTVDERIRDMFSDYYIIEEEVHHNSKRADERKQTELFIANFPLVREQGNLLAELSD